LEFLRSALVKIFSSIFYGEIKVSENIEDKSKIAIVIDNDARNKASEKISGSVCIHEINTFESLEIDIAKHPEMGELFFLNNVLQAIEYTQDAAAASRLIDDDLKVKLPIYNSKTKQYFQQWYITEFGLYQFLGRTNAPKAKKFQRWTYEVIQEIRKTGSYSLNNTQSRDLSLITNTVNTLVDTVGTLKVAVEGLVVSVNNFDKDLHYLRNTNLKLLNLVSDQQQTIKNEQEANRALNAHQANKQQELDSEINKARQSQYLTIFEYIKTKGKNIKDLTNGYTLGGIGKEITNYMYSIGTEPGTKEKSKTNTYPLTLLAMYFDARQPLK
jgi:prophage antirepressor-like protein/DNA-binding protein H-NS